MTEISGSLIVRQDQLLMIFDDENEEWNVPSDQGEKGELSAETVERVVEERTGCSCEISRYRKQFKTTFEREGEIFTWQPFAVELEGEPEEAEWIPLEELASKELADPISNIHEKLASKL